MPFNRSMPSRELAELFRRLATSLAVGIDPVRAWASEAGRVPARWRPAVAAVADALRAGEPLADALARAGEAFSAETRALLEAGDRTGRDADVFRELAEAHRRIAAATRRLRSGLVRPLFQLALALAAFGILILVSDPAKGIDLTGLGLSGFPGLRTYTGVVAMVGVFSFLLVGWCIRSWKQRGLVRHWVAPFPGIGGVVRAWELSAWCRAASLASAVGLDIGRLVKLASAAAPGLACDATRVVRRLEAGGTLTEALQDEGILQGRDGRRVGAALEVGEATGSTAETLDRLAGQLFDEASDGLASLATWAGHAVWAFVAIAAGAVVVRVFSSYAGMLESLSRPSL